MPKKTTTPFLKVPAATGESSLMLAVTHGDVAQVTKLFATGATFMPGLARTSLFHLAIQAGHTSVLKVLCALDKTNMDMPDSKGETPLCRAVERGDVSAVRCLLEAGADSKAVPSTESSLLASALAHCVGEKLFSICELLLVHGANPNVELTEQKRRPLHVAARMNNVALVELFLKFKADPFLVDASGKNPFEWARIMGMEEAANRLKACVKPKKVKPEDPLMVAGREAIAKGAKAEARRRESLAASAKAPHYLRDMRRHLMPCAGQRRGSARLREAALALLAASALTKGTTGTQAVRKSKLQPVDATPFARMATRASKRAAEGAVSDSKRGRMALGGD